MPMPLRVFLLSLLRCSLSATRHPPSQRTLVLPESCVFSALTASFAASLKVLRDILSTSSDKYIQGPSPEYQATSSLLDYFDCCSQTLRKQCSFSLLCTMRQPTLYNSLVSLQGWQHGWHLHQAEVTLTSVSRKPCSNTQHIW